MKYIVILLLLLQSCAIIPNKVQQFPEPPSNLMVQPINLKLINKEYKSLSDGTNSTILLSDYVKSVTVNYGICESNSSQLSSLQSWIESQFNLFNKNP